MGVKIPDLPEETSPDSGAKIPSSFGGVTSFVTIATLATAVGVALNLGDLATLDTVGSAQITNSSITPSDFQNVAESRLLGRGQGSGSGIMQELVLGDGLTLLGGTLGVDTADLGSTPYTSFDPTAWPAGTHADSDDFLNETASAAKWTEWDVDTHATITYDEDLKRAIVEVVGTSGPSASGIAQAAPSSEFTIIAYVALEDPLGSGAEAAAGIFVGQDVIGSPSTADFHTLKLDLAAGTGSIKVQSWADYDGAITTHVTRGSFAGGAYWLRIRVNGTSVSCDVAYQDTPIGWQQIDGPRTLSYTPSTFGVLANTDRSGSYTVRAIVTDFLVFDGISDFNEHAAFGKTVTLRAAP